MEHVQIALRKSGMGLGTAWFRPDDLPRQPLQPASDALWASLPAAKADPVRLAAGRIVTVGRTDPAQVAFDILRTRVLQHLQQNNWTTIAITSPGAGAGKSNVALNLAFSLANRPDCRTVLVDLDLRRPRIARALGIRNASRIEDFLRGSASLEQSFQRLGANLAIAPNAQPVKLSAELLQAPETANTFRELRRKLAPDVLLCDLPPMLASDDVMAFLPNVDCVILVVEAEADTLAQVDACEQELAQATNVLGVVLNKCRHLPEAVAYDSGGT